MGREALFDKSSKYKLNSKRSTEAELVATSEVLPQILWNRHILKDQGYIIKG